VKTVLYSSPFVPAEWLSAHGMRPERIRPDPSASAPSVGPLMGMCPFARAFAGDALARADAAGVVFATTCDQMRRASELVAMHGRRPVFLMNVPATWQTPVAARLYLDELGRLGRFLVRLGGSEPSREALCRTLEAWDAQRERLRGALGLLAPRRASEAMAEFDLDWRTALTASGPRAPGGTPVALVGGPLMRGHTQVFDTIEQAGGAVVLDATESGAWTLPAPFDRRRLRDDPVMELVDAYFGTIPGVFRRPDEALYAYLDRELAASGARGIVVWRYVWCDLWAAAVARLRERTGLPVTDLDVSGDEGAFAHTAGRIQAFMEVLR
jgi:benzoyl-CoA reductase/2-hydroxyglutaryl-CoA dehydratase subunit BcrC/BadD/HgdB